VREKEEERAYIEEPDKHDKRNRRDKRDKRDKPNELITNN